MATLTVSGTTWNYTYDANGMRTKRTNGSTTYEYVYSGDKLVQVIATDHTTTPETVSVVEYTYDVAGQPLTMTLGNDVYYYVLNIQGDVMGLVDSSGTLMISYIYEGYGETYSVSNTSSMTATLSNANMLTYRGYVLDKGTGLYYLQSRYYDPNVGRFINADSLISTGQGLLGNNMFAYCLNNPVNFTDPSGYCSYLGSIYSPKLDCGSRYCPTSSSYVACVAGVVAGSVIMFSKQRTLRGDTGLQDIPTDEISRRARDKNLSGEERNRYRREEKKRKERNKQKRKSNFSSEIDWEPITGVAFVTIGVVITVVVVADDATGAGVADDAALIPLVELIRQGVNMIVR